MNGVAIPEVQILRKGFEPVRFQPADLHMTDFGAWWMRERFRDAGGRLRRIGGGSGQLSAWAEQTCLNHLTGYDNAAWANLAPTYLAECTTLPTSSSTGSTIVEASYGSYARTSMANTIWGAASGTAPASITNSGAGLTAAGCTSSTSTIVGLAACTASTAGNVIFWMSCASVVISTTQTPATVAASALTFQMT